MTTLSRAFLKTTNNNFSFKVNLSKIEKEGVKSILDQKFKAVYGENFDFYDILACYFTNYDDHAKLVAQNKMIEIDEGHFISHFVVTENHDDILVVTYDDNDNEHLYFVLD